MEDSQVKPLMTQTERILNEKDPILREIFAMGYTEVRRCHPSNKILLSSESQYAELDYFEFEELSYSLKRINAVLIDGTPHCWISEEDGSAERLREFIKPQITKTV